MEIPWKVWRGRSKHHEGIVTASERGRSTHAYTCEHGLPLVASTRHIYAWQTTVNCVEGIEYQAFVAKATCFTLDVYQCMVAN